MSLFCTLYAKVTILEDQQNFCQTKYKIDVRRESKPRMFYIYIYMCVCVCVCVCVHRHIRGCIKKFPDWLSGARTLDGTALCHKVQLYRYFVSQSSEFCSHNPLCRFSTSVYCCKRIFLYRLSPETFGYNLVYIMLYFNVG
jgi:hypothetical protein